MDMSDSIKEIATAMNKAQAEMTAAKKDASNPFFKSKYADLGSIIKALKEAFANNGLSYMQSPEMDDSGVGVTTMIMHDSGEWIRGTLFIPMTKKDPQGAGSAITYARRYALQAMVGLPASDDDAEFAMGRDKAEDTITQQQCESLRSALAMTNINEESLCQKVRISELSMLDKSRFDGAMDFLKAKAMDTTEAQ